MSRIKKVLLGFAILGLSFIYPATVLAANPLCPPLPPKSASMSQAEYNELKKTHDELLKSEVCQTQSDPIAGPGGLVSDVTSIVAVVAGIAAVVMIMVGGFKFITSGGDSGKVQDAKKTIMWSVVGLVIIVLSRTIIVFVLERV